LKPERWGSPLVQEKFQEEKACDKRHPYCIIIIIEAELIIRTRQMKTAYLKAKIKELENNTKIKKYWRLA